MRTIEDPAGRQWDVAVSAGSYGEQRLIFCVRAGRELRAHVLALHDRMEAEQELRSMSEPELRRLLVEAPQWQPG